MKVEEVYIDLFENYRVLDQTWQEFMTWARFEEPSMFKSFRRDEREVVSLMKDKLQVNVRNLPQAYEYLMKKNVKLVGRADVPTDPKQNDSSYWIGVFKKYMRADSRENRIQYMQLYLEVNDFGNKIFKTVNRQVERAEDKAFKKDYDVVHKGSGWIMFKPNHRAAACTLGTGTTWCISSRGNENYFNSYSERAVTYIIHTNSGRKFAILLNKSNGGFFEVQTEENDFGHPDDSVLKSFAKSMKEAGVDVPKVEQLLDVQFTHEFILNRVWFELGEDGIKATPNSEVYSTLGIYKCYMEVIEGDRWKKEFESRDMIFVARKVDGGHDIAYMSMTGGDVKKRYLSGAISAYHPGATFMWEKTDMHFDPYAEDTFYEQIREAIEKDLNVDPWNEMVPTSEILANVKANVE